ncbi:DUF441 domain-containing protein [Bombilactobacillus thymidiniphilus]|uniref:UPF0756 membrane protein MOO47_00560 n=1 Tax=Bombilactobacillus thymidiniphilus TaxID=2923363 RepID=A0ABY4PEK9_9LACO|nr:DUF441 domain-containing protein [Bombilactobacillus thymidiniphilus]UQS83727.1 DUF441 domain-containing protein [Bombilactobacillus thymidiniphilus]
MESWIFLLLIFLIAFLSKNISLQIAAIIALVIKVLPHSQRILELIQSKGINVGVTVISVAILMPIALGQIGFKDLISAFKSPVGYVAIFCGILVAVLSKKGVGLMSATPEITVSLVFGTILGVVVFKGIAAGPVIASGMAYCIITLLANIGIK